MNRYAITLGAVVAAAGVFGSGAVNAAEIEALHFNQAVGAMCQGALPNYEGSFRKRPLAIKNEGSSSAFLTCGVSTQFDDVTGGVPFVELVVTNRNAVDTSISCTLVDGIIDPLIGFADYFPQTISVVAGEPAAFEWDANGGGGTFDPVFGFPALSCNVPANVEINREAHIYLEEIGA